MAPLHPVVSQTYAKDRKTCLNNPPTFWKQKEPVTTVYVGGMIVQGHGLGKGGVISKFPWLGIIDFMKAYRLYDG